jgi:hypothetical protein
VGCPFFFNQEPMGFTLKRLRIMWLFHPKSRPPFPKGNFFCVEAVQITVQQILSTSKSGQKSFSLDVEYKATQLTLTKDLTMAKN